MDQTRIRALATGVAATVLLAGCTAVVPMRPADDATNPVCADVSVNLPDTIDEAELRQTDAQATAAWGTPAAVLLRCGVTVPGPSTDRCITIGEIDWLVDDRDPARGVFTTYGRDPAVEVIVDDAASDSNALVALTDAVGRIPVTGACTSPEDVFG